MPLTPAEATTDWVELVTLAHAMVHGPATGAGSTVVTDNGVRPTLPKAINDLEESATASAAAAAASAADTANDRTATAANKAATNADAAATAIDRAATHADRLLADTSATTATTQAGVATAAAGALAGNVANRRTVRAAATANVNIANPGTSTFDGIVLVAGERVLLPWQTTASESGVYDFSGSAVAMTRSVDSDVSAEMPPGLEVVVTEGDFFKNRSFLLTTAGPIVLGTTALVFKTLDPPDAPYFMVDLNGQDRGSNPPNTTTVIVCDHIVADNRGWYSVVNYRYTPKLPGFYHFGGVTNWSFTATSSDSTQTYIYKNGLLGLAGNNAGVSGVMTGAASVVSGYIYMNGSTDYVDMRSFVGSNADKMRGHVAQTFFYGRWIGDKK